MRFESWVLEALAKHGRLRALEIKDMAQEDGITVSLGGIYTTMERYVELGWVAEEDEPGGEDRRGRSVRYWRLTDEGRRAARERSVPRFAVPVMA